MMKAFRHRKIASCAFTSLPKEIENLQQLLHLFVTRNSLIAPFLSQLQSQLELMYLRISRDANDNRISVIPPYIGNLSSLIQL